MKDEVTRHRPSWTGGVARSAGVVVQEDSMEQPPRLRGFGRSRGTSLIAQPPLLSRRGDAALRDAPNILAPQVRVSTKRRGCLKPLLSLRLVLVVQVRLVGLEVLDVLLFSVHV